MSCIVIIVSDNQQEGFQVHARLKYSTHVSGIYHERSFYTHTISDMGFLRDHICYLGYTRLISMPQDVTV